MLNISPTGAKTAIQMINDSCPRPLPGIGSPVEQYAVKLSEQELHAIWSAVARIQAECETLERLSSMKEIWWQRYGPVLVSLSKRLGAAFDDGTISEERI